MPNSIPIAKKAEQLTEQARQATTQQRAGILEALSKLYASQLESLPEEDARAVRLAFLKVLGNMPNETIDPRYSRFLAENVQPEDFIQIEREAPDKVIEFCELLYSFEFQDAKMEERVNFLVSRLLHDTLQQYQREKNPAKVFSLLQLTPGTPVATNRELQRLRNRAYLYEMRRIQRNRRLLFFYLVVQVVLIVVIFPQLFINAENGVIRDKIEHSTNQPLPEEQRRFFTYGDGLYWAVITAASIGYGDITPKTWAGKTIASVLGVMGVVTVGVIAGLVLEWITPRSLD